MGKRDINPCNPSVYDRCPLKREKREIHKGGIPGV